MNLFTKSFLYTTFLFENVGGIYILVIKLFVHCGVGNPLYVARYVNQIPSLALLYIQRNVDLAGSAILKISITIIHHVFQSENTFIPDLICYYMSGLVSYFVLYLTVG